MEPGKEFTIPDDKGPKDVITYEKEGVFLTTAYAESNQKPKKIFGKATFLLQFKNGEYIIAASEKSMLLYSTLQQKPIAQKIFNYVYSVSLSPCETYLQVLDKITINQGQTIIFSLPNLVELATYKEDHSTGYFNRQHFPLIRFSADDSHYFRYNNKLVEVYDGKLHEKVSEIMTGQIQFFEISKVSKGKEYFLVAIYLDKKTNQGKCQIFTQKSPKEPLYNKNIKKAEQIKIKFSSINNQFLMQLQTYFDPTGKSYYGEFGIFLYNDVKNRISSVKAQNGPVHDFSWHPSGDKFIVISGFMPASIKMFNQENEPVFQFGKKHRNYISWGNLGRFLCLAGFGNLTGEMEMWDLKEMKQIGFCKSSSASYCQWSLDDRKVLTGIVTPRLRVDNCFKVFSYTGTYLKKVGYEETQLYGAHWLKLPNYKGEARGVSPGRKIQTQPKKEEGKFKSFGSSLNFGSLTLNEKKQQKQKPKLIPGQFPDQQVHKKKRRRKNNKDVDALDTK